jgi:hypothetical protein
MWRQKIGADRQSERFSYLWVITRSAIPNLNEMWEPYPGNRAKICPKWNKALVFRHSFAREGIHSSKIPPDLELLMAQRKSGSNRLTCAIMPPMQQNLCFANNNDNDNDAVRGVGRSFAG